MLLLDILKNTSMCNIYICNIQCMLQAPGFLLSPPSDFGFRVAFMESSGRAQDLVQGLTASVLIEASTR